MRNGGCDIERLEKMIEKIRAAIMFFLLGLILLLTIWFAAFISYTKESAGVTFVGIIAVLMMFLALYMLREAAPPRGERGQPQDEFENEEIIRRLKALREAYDNGVIDAAEYAAKRAEILREL